jgi:hypothetical protein
MVVILRRLRSKPRRMTAQTKDHPSRLAEVGSHLRMTRRIDENVTT